MRGLLAHFVRELFLTTLVYSGKNPMTPKRGDMGIIMLVYLKTLQNKYEVKGTRLCYQFSYFNMLIIINVTVYLGKTMEI